MPETRVTQADRLMFGILRLMKGLITLPVGLRPEWTNIPVLTIVVGSALKLRLFFYSSIPENWWNPSYRQRRRHWTWKTLTITHPWNTKCLRILTRRQKDVGRSLVSFPWISTILYTPRVRESQGTCITWDVWNNTSPLSVITFVTPSLLLNIP